jgi:hypothetical protein
LAIEFDKGKLHEIKSWKAITGAIKKFRRTGTKVKFIKFQIKNPNF